MLIPNQTVIVKWTGANRKHLESLGYSFTKKGVEIEIKANELSNGSPTKVLFQCDFCGETYSSRYSNVFNFKNHFCSRKCKCDWNTANPRTQIKTTCGNCDTEVTTVPSKLNKSASGMVFCSNICVGEYNSKRHKENRVVKQCTICDTTYDVKPSEAEQNVTCSRECQVKWQSQYLRGEKANNFNQSYSLEDRMHNCDWCGEKYKLKNLDKVNKKGNKDNPYFCSKKCYREWYAKDWSQREEWKEESRQRTVGMISDGKFPKINTLIQQIVEGLLSRLNIEFIAEYNCKYYAVDLYLPNHNLFIELMGSYWHCDPRRYVSIEYKVQFNRIIGDKRKRTFIKEKYNSNILYLWEDDIMNNLEIVERLILSFIENNGILSNYNSFNYSTINGEIEENNDILLPYFDRDIDFINSIYIPKDTNQVIDKKQYDKWITFNCDECGKEKEQLKSHYKNSKNHFCSSKCTAIYRIRNRPSN